MLDWISAHYQELTIALTIVIAIFNWVTKPRTPEELASYPARVAAFFRFMNALFPDPEKMSEAIWQAWKDTHDRLPSKQASKDE